MKTLICLMLLSFSAFGQDIAWIGDDYGIYEDEPATCSREACIDLDGIEMGFYSMQDIDGEEFLKLNTESSLMDMNLDRACFRGDKKEVLDIIQSLAGNTNEYYYQGGHVSVVGIYAKVLTDNKIVLKTTYITNYDQGQLSFDQTINKCK